MEPLKRVQIRFDGPPSHESGRFVEVEDADTGASIRFGEWKQDGDYWLLQFATIDDPAKFVEAVRELYAKARVALRDLANCALLSEEHTSSHFHGPKRAAEWGKKRCDIETQLHAALSNPALAKLRRK